MIQGQGGAAIFWVMFQVAERDMNSMRRMLEVSIGRSKLLEVDVGICRQVSICRRSRDELRGGNAIGDRQPFGAAPGDLPEFVRRAPEGAEALRALAQTGLVASDANRDDVVVTAPGVNTMNGRASLDLALRNQPDLDVAPHRFGILP